MGRGAYGTLHSVLLLNACCSLFIVCVHTGLPSSTAFLIIRAPLFVAHCAFTSIKCAPCVYAATVVALMSMLRWRDAYCVMLCSLAQQYILIVSIAFSLPCGELTVQPGGPLPFFFPPWRQIFSNQQVSLDCWLLGARNSSLMRTADFSGTVTLPSRFCLILLVSFMLWFNSSFLYATLNKYGWPSVKWLVIHPQDNGISTGEVRLTHVNRIICRVISSAETLIWQWWWWRGVGIGVLLAVFTLGLDLKISTWDNSWKNNVCLEKAAEL